MADRSSGDEERFRRAAEILRPGGKLIGEAGANRNIRFVDGGENAAVHMFEMLAGIGEEVEAAHPRMRRVAVGELGHVAYRPFSRSSHPTIDVTITDIGIDEIKFR